MKTHVVIMAGGQGTRLFPLSRLVIALAYPLGWVVCSSILFIYYYHSELGPKRLKNS